MPPTFAQKSQQFQLVIRKVKLPANVVFMATYFQRISPEILIERKIQLYGFL